MQFHIRTLVISLNWELFNKTSNLIRSFCYKLLILFVASVPVATYYVQANGRINFLKNCYPYGLTPVFLRHGL
jgi:hypothetical protein